MSKLNEGSLAIFSVITGEAILARISTDNTQDDCYDVRNMALVKLDLPTEGEGEQRIKIGLMPYYPYAKGDIGKVFKRHIVSMSEPNDQLATQHGKIFNTGIIMPSEDPSVTLT